MFLGPRIGTNQSGLLRGFLKLSDAESVNFHRVPNQVEQSGAKKRVEPEIRVADLRSPQIDARDLNQDGIINLVDAKILVTLCTVPVCDRYLQKYLKKVEE